MSLHSTALRFGSSLLLLALGLCGSARPVEAETSGAPAPPAPTVTAGAEIDLNSRYAWRGLALSEGAVLQPSLWVSAGAFTFTAWNNVALHRGDAHPRWNELDLNLAYSATSGKVGIEPSFQAYLYPGQDDVPTTGELGLTLTLPLRENLELFTRHAYDVVRYDGAYYAELGVQAEREIGRRIHLEAEGSLGWGSPRFYEANVGVRRGGYALANLEVRAPIQVSKRATIRPHFGYSHILSRAIRKEVENPAGFRYGLAIGSEW